MVEAGGSRIFRRCETRNLLIFPDAKKRRKLQNELNCTYLERDFSLLANSVEEDRTSTIGALVTPNDLARCRPIPPRSGHLAAIVAGTRGRKHWPELCTITTRSST